MKLYPPYIEGTIPAFSIKQGQGATVNIPFAMNKAVGTADFDSISLKVKTINSSDYLFETLCTGYDLNKNYATFDLTMNEVAQLNIGQYYKVQLAYVQTGDTNNYGYYSTVGVVKCTSEPEVIIDNLTRAKLNPHLYNYTGRYKNEGDPAEKVASYRFMVFDDNLNVVKDTGELIHNNTLNPSPYECFDNQDFLFDLNSNKIYYIQYIITTTNNLVVKTPKYKITQNESFDPRDTFKVLPILNYDNGYIDVSFDSEGKRITGTFVLSRSCSDTNFTEWERLGIFKLKRENPAEVFHKRDFAIEQGRYYIYGIQQYNNVNTYSKRICSEKIYADFENVFLTDGEKQLKLPFNTNITNFKTNQLEQKIDTIGSKYPKFFKNGRVKYKEFNISSLISYLGDEENLFSDVYKTYDSTRTHTWISTPEQMVNKLQKRVNELNIELYSENSKWVRFRARLTAEQLAALEDELVKAKQSIKYINKTKIIENEIHQTIEDHHYQTTLLTPYNYQAEREHKLQVLDWLNNGKVKMFRSPQEGNYLVRLMTVSLSPEDKINRLIHNFQATAFECDDYNYENLIKYNVIKVEDLQPDLTWGQSELSSPNYSIGENYDEESDSYESLYINEETNEIMKVYDGTVSFAGGEVLPDGVIAYSVFFRDMLPGSIIMINNNEIQIGATGSYYVESPDGIYSIFIPNNEHYTGSFTYTYYDIYREDFSKYESTSFKDVPCEQFIGQHNNIIESLNDIKTEVKDIYYIRARKRNIIPNVYEHDGDIYFNYNASTDTYSNKATDILPLYVLNIEGYQVCKDLTTNQYLTFTQEDFIDLVDLGYTDIDLLQNTFEVNSIYTLLPKYLLSEENYFLYYFKNDETDEYTQADIYDRTLDYYQKEPAIIDLTETEYQSIEDLDTDLLLNTGNGVYIEIGYRAKIYNYAIENNPEDAILKNYQNQLYHAESIMYDAVNYTQNNAIEKFIDAVQEQLLSLIEELEEQKTNGTITTEAYEVTYQTYAGEYFTINRWYENYVNNPDTVSIASLLESITIDTSSLIDLLMVSEDIEDARNNHAEYYRLYIERLEWLLNQGDDGE